MTAGWSADLTYGYLEGLLEAARSRFKLGLLRDGPGGDQDPPRAIVRHDIDVSLQRAVDLAEQEASWGVSATFLVQVDCPLYRVDDRDGRDALRHIVALGHEVGLHFDAGTEPGRPNFERIEPRVRQAAMRLAEVIGATVKSVSFHRPESWLLRGPDMVGGMVNAYGAGLMSTYLSDSEGRWRNGEPLPQVRETTDRFLQLLVHPIWWAKEHRAPGDRLQEFFETRTMGLGPEAIEDFDAQLLRAVEPARRSGLR